MHDSLPMVLFRFEILVKLQETRELAWVADFFPGVLLNEGMSHKPVDPCDRAGGFQIAPLCLMKINVTCGSRSAWPGAKPLGRKAAGPKECRLMFDYKLVLHTTNTTTGIVYKIKLARTPISLRVISTVPAEKKLSETRMHAGVYQTIVELVKTMEDDKTLQFIDVQDQVKNWRLAYGETISPCVCLTGIGIMPFIYVEAVIHIVEFPGTISPPLGETITDEFHIFAEKLMSEALLPFAKTNFNIMNV
jgi:hypothetical protein